MATPHLVCRQCTTIVVYFVPKDDKVVQEPAAKRAKKACELPLMLTVMLM